MSGLSTAAMRPQHDALTLPLVATFALIGFAVLSLFDFTMSGAVVYTLYDRLSTAALVVLGASAYGWARVAGSRAGRVSGWLLLVVLAAVVLSFVTNLMDGPAIGILWRVIAATHAVGYALFAFALAAPTPSRRPDALAWTGVALAGCGTILQLSLIAGVPVENAYVVSDLLMYAGLVLVLVSVRAALRRGEAAARPPGPMDRDDLQAGLEGARTFKTGVVVQLVTLLAGLVLGLMAFGLRSRAVATLFALGVLAGTLIGQLLILQGVSRLRRLPAASGARAHGNAAWTIYLILFALSTVVVVTSLLALVAPRLIDGMQDTEVESLAILPALIGQLLLFAGLARTGRWLRAPAVTRYARRAMLWFSVTAALQFPLRTPSFARDLGLSGPVVLVLAVLLLASAVAALAQLFGVLATLDTALSRETWLAPFGDDEEPA
ncbi:MAG: hypothetical protein CVU56_03325 [Deltaproteobacteria bacterium HGW-Deltaproteobacteria-14]|nr:MAG: hypothetical protein CVU56_03325 [Deltaproteobacteria bacterium HGW-Deltaproteobacteria-14]